MESNPYAPPQVADLAPPRSEIQQAEAIRQEHIKVEATVKSVGTLYYLGAFLLLGFSILLPLTTTTEDERAETILPVAVAGLLLLGIVQFVLAYGLRRLRSWARWPTVVLSFIGLLGFPVGTLISIVILVSLIGKKANMVFSPEYKDIIAATPYVKYKTSIVVKILLALLLLALLLIISSLFIGRA